MTISINPSTLVITVPQADCTFVSGTFYRLPTETVFRAAVNDILDNESGVFLPNAISHNTEVTVAGVTYARFIELINGYSVQFTPNTQWTVELTESNNNLHDVASGALVQNQVQVITTNAAGLITVTSGSALLPAEAVQLRDIHKLLGLDKSVTITITPTGIDSDDADIDINLTGDGIATTTMDRQP